MHVQQVFVGNELVGERMKTLYRRWRIPDALERIPAARDLIILNVVLMVRARGHAGTRRKYHSIVAARPPSSGVIESKGSSALACVVSARWRR